jgi:hypothetical protein
MEEEKRGRGFTIWPEGMALTPSASQPASQLPHPFTHSSRSHSLPHSPQVRDDLLLGPGLPRLLR